jgi:hypothetical protein
VDFPSIPLLIAYNSQHFEPIEYDNCVPRFFHTFEPNDPKVTINLDEFPLATISNTNASTQFAFLLE